MNDLVEISISDSIIDSVETSICKLDDFSIGDLCYNLVWNLRNSVRKDIEK